MGFNKICLGEVIQTNAISYKKSDCWAFVNYLDTGNITENVVCEIQRIDLDKEPLPSRAKRKVQYNSIIYSTVRPNQRHYGIIKNIPQNFLVSTGFTVIDAIPEKIDANYLFYLLTQRDIIESLQAIAEQSVSTYPSISPSDIENLEVWLPELSEQKKIAAILSALDEKIAINRAINENLERQLDAFFENIFHDINGEVALGNVVKTISGGTPSRKHVDYYENGTICWVKSKELSGGYIFDTEEHINDLALAKSSAKIIPPHAILVAMYGATVGSYGIITKAMACNQAICALIDSENYPYTYLYQIVRTQQRTLTNMAIGSAQQNISQILIKQLPLHNDTDTIAKFHTFAQPLQKRIELLEYENKQIMSIRDTLLPKLMSGEIDVSAVQL